MLPKNVTDAEVSAIFSKYGNIKDLHILRGSQQTSKGKKKFLHFWVSISLISLFFLILLLLQAVPF